MFKDVKGKRDVSKDEEDVEGGWQKRDLAKIGESAAAVLLNAGLCQST
jgi:hypothetical protein